MPLQLTAVAPRSGTERGGVGSNLQQLLGPGMLGPAAVERGSVDHAQGGDGDGWGVSCPTPITMLRCAMSTESGNRRISYQSISR